MGFTPLDRKELRDIRAFWIGTFLTMLDGLVPQYSSQPALVNPMIRNMWNQINQPVQPYSVAIAQCFARRVETALPDFGL